MKFTSTRRALFASITVSSLLLGCQAIVPPKAGQVPFGTVAQITSMSPDVTRELRVGERVQLKVDVRYVLTADTGTIRLIVLAADNATVAQQEVRLARGGGTATLEAEFTVPRTTQIRVYTPLVYQDQDATSTTDGRSFAVVQR